MVMLHQSIGLCEILKYDSFFFSKKSVLTKEPFMKEKNGISQSDRGKIDTLSVIFKPFYYYLEFSVLSPQLAQIMLTQLNFGPTQYVTSLEYKVLTTKTFCIQVCVQGKFQKSRFHCVILKRASSLPAIFISLIIESIFLALYIYFFDLSPTTPANEISKSKVADFRFQSCIFNNTLFPYPSRIPFCVSGQEISFGIESPVASLSVENLCRVVSDTR